MIYKIPYSVDCNYWLNRLDTLFYESTIQNSLKVPKFVKPTYKKTILRILGTSLINSPYSPSFLENSTCSIFDGQIYFNYRVDVLMKILIKLLIKLIGLVQQNIFSLKIFIIWDV